MGSSTRGFGSVTRYRDRWRARIHIAGRREAKTCRSKAEGELWLRHKRLEKIEVEATGRRRSRENPKVGELADQLAEYWRAGIKRRYTPDTLRGYLGTLQLVVDDLEDVRVRYFDQKRLDDYVIGLRQRGLASSTIRHRLHVLGQMFQLAQRKGYIVNPPCRIERPRIFQKTEREAISEADLDALLSEANEQETRILLLAADAGLRVGEIVKLEWRDIRGDSIVIPVRSEADRPKSGRGASVPILTGRLRDVLSQRGPAATRVCGVASKDQLRNRLRRLWKLMLGDTPKLHSLRHRFCTRLADAGVPIPKIQAWARHADIQTTMRYVHASAEPSQRAQRALEPSYSSSHSGSWEPGDRDDGAANQPSCS